MMDEDAVAPSSIALATHEDKENEEDLQALDTYASAVTRNVFQQPAAKPVVKSILKKPTLTTSVRSLTCNSHEWG